MTFRENLRSSITSSAYEADDGLKLGFVQVHKNVSLIAVSDSYNIGNKSVLEFCQETCKNLREELGVVPLITGYQSGVVILEVTDEKNPVLMFVRRSHAKTTKATKEAVGIEIISTPEFVTTFVDKLDAAYSTIKEASVEWWYMGKNGPNSIQLLLHDEESLMNPEFYPCFPKDPIQYFEDYIEDKAPLLFLSGPPGTGKTSWIRAMLLKYALNAYVAYDKKLFESDALFIDFIASTRTNFLIFEDAEHAVLPRDTGNTMMSRFLNVSEGLLKFPKKKIIFSTNESNFEKIDQALIRPGRCYDFVEFRNLDHEECVAAAKIAGLPVPKDHKAHSLAELFNYNTKKHVPPKIGF